MSKWDEQNIATPIKDEKEMLTKLHEYSLSANPDIQMVKCYICDRFGDLELWLTMICVPKEIYTIQDGQLVKASKQRWAHKACLEEPK